MAYSDYKSLSEIERKLGVKNQRKSLFENVTIQLPSADLSKALKTANELPIRSEKAKSELIVMPILLDLRNRNDNYFTIYSGDNLNIDESLKGECDFILAKDTGSYEISYPILQIVEAKKNDVEIGIPQCAAQMIGAKRFNEVNEVPTTVIYGCVTTGDDWLFMKLEEHLQIDTRKYYLGNVGELLGVFQQILSIYKQNLL